MSFSIETFTEAYHAIDIGMLNDSANRFFRRLLNLDNDIDLKLKFRKGYQEQAFETLIPNEDLFFIESEFLDVYLMLHFEQDRSYELMGFDKTNYIFHITGLKVDIERIEIVLALSILFAVASYFGNDFINADNIFPNVMKLDTAGNVIYYINDILHSVKENNLKPFSQQSILEFNRKAFQTL